MKNSKKGFIVPLLVAIVAVLIIGGGVYIYSNRKAVSVTPTGTQVNDNPISDNKNTAFQPLPSDNLKIKTLTPTAPESQAKLFIENMMKELSFNSPIIATTKNVNFSGSGNGIKSKKLSGYSVSPVSMKSNNYYLSKSFKPDIYNSGDATLHSTEGYKNSSIICINYYNTVAPNNDYSQCDTTPTSKCSSSSETFCADLNQ